MNSEKRKQASATQEKKKKGGGGWFMEVKKNANAYSQIESSMHIP